MRVSNHAMTGPLPVNHSLSLSSKFRWCVPKHVSTVVIFCVFGSHICTWRLLCAIGTTFADGWLDPSRQNAAVSLGRMRAATQTRACLSIAKLCASDLLFQIASSAQYTEDAAGG